MEKITGVYLITNTVNGKSYVGSSSNIVKRWSNHRCESTWKKSSSRMYIDMQYYGLDKFKFEVLEKCTEEELLIKEREYIEKLGTMVNGYNVVIPYRPEEEAKAIYKIYKDKYNKEHSKEHTLYMRAYKKRIA